MTKPTWSATAIQQRLEALQHLRNDFSRRRANASRLARAPIEALDLIRPHHPSDCQSNR